MAQTGKPRREAIYLHYLDRELNDAAGARIDEIFSIRWTRLLIFLTQAELYCALSSPWENGGLGPRVREDLQALLLAGELFPVSHDFTLAEFLASRRAAYEHDQSRYPNYFTSSSDHLTWLRPLRHKSTGSTVPLVSFLTGWTESLPDPMARFSPAIARLRDPVRKALFERAGEAVTYSYFRQFLGDLASDFAVEATLRRRISEGFTLDYTRYFGGDIATGIPELLAFEKLAVEFPIYDVQILGMIAHILGISALFDAVRTGVDAFRPYAIARTSQPMQLLAGEVRWIIGALYRQEFAREATRADDADEFQQPTQVRRRMLSALRNASQVVARPEPPGPGTPADQIAADGISRLEWLAHRLADGSPVIKADLEATRSMVVVETVDVVVVTVNDIETDAITAALENAGHVGRGWMGSKNVYWLYGPVGGATVAHVRCTMGSLGQGGSAMTVADAIRELTPGAVIGIGVAYGVDERKQPIGQLLLSQKLTQYELQRIGTDSAGGLQLIPRGPSTEASSRLLGRFRDARLADIGIEVKAGEMLSGEKLLDNEEFKAALVDRYPEAIGGEMEGAGVQAASGRENVDWLVAKAVCDYAANKGVDKERNQRQAATAAARALLHVLEAGGLVRSR